MTLEAKTTQAEIQAAEAASITKLQCLERPLTRLVMTTPMEAELRKMLRHQRHQTLVAELTFVKI